jgi:hypothetical protein
MKSSKNMLFCRDHSLSFIRPRVMVAQVVQCLTNFLNPYCADKRFFKNLGFSKDDFHVTTWLTSWALSGTHEHELPCCDTSEAKEFLPSRYAYHLLKTCSVFLFIFYVLKVFLGIACTADTADISRYSNRFKKSRIRHIVYN